MNYHKQQLADFYVEFCIHNRSDPNHPTHRLNPEKDKALAERVAKEGVKPENFLTWTRAFVENHPAALIGPAPVGETGKERWAIANSEKYVPAVKPNPKPAPVHPGTGRSYYDVVENQKAEVAAKKERQRATRNPFRLSHLRDPEDAE